MTFAFQPIGVIKSPYRDVYTTPIQTLLNPDARAQVRVYEKFVAGLAGLDGFDYAYLITALSAVPAGDANSLQPTPILLRGTGRHVGVFATRFPLRPNSVGLSLVRIQAIGRDTIDFSGVDMVDGTPVLDIKPWVPAFDVPASAADVRIGWYAGADLPTRPARAARRKLKSATTEKER
jgi:tRNA-Thr(GGU) m(6)t(6)A37 methyltransferase TsaA